MIFKKKVHNNSLYNTLLSLSRNIFFYKKIKLSDSFETRIYLMFLNFSIMMIVSKKKGKKFDQQSYDSLFDNIEYNLREMGFGDIAVNKKMKLFIKAFYGRIAQYNRGMSNYIDGKDKSLLEQTILNNIYKGQVNNKEKINSFVNYMLNNIKHFSKYTEKDNLINNFNFVSFN